MHDWTTVTHEAAPVWIWHVNGRNIKLTELLVCNQWQNFSLILPIFTIVIFELSVTPYTRPDWPTLNYFIFRSESRYCHTEIWPFEGQITVSPASYCFYHAKNFPIPILKQLPHYEVCKYAVALCVFQAKYRKSNLIPTHLHLRFMFRFQRVHSTFCHQKCVKNDETYCEVISEFCVELKARCSYYCCYGSNHGSIVSDLHAFQDNKADNRV